MMLLPTTNCLATTRCVEPARERRLCKLTSFLPAKWGVLLLIPRVKQTHAEIFLREVCLEETQVPHAFAQVQLRNAMFGNLDGRKRAF